MHFGDLFADRFPIDSWLDSGGGFGLASLDAAATEKVGRAVVINAQDALAPLRTRNYEWFRTHAGTFKTGRITVFAGYEVFAKAMIDPERGIFKPNAIEIFVDAGSDRLARLEQSGRFEYLTGFSEKVLATVKSKFKFVTDLFGAYFYSAQRPRLISEYYQHLAAGGEALVVFHARDIEWKYDKTTARHYDIVSEYGPRNFVRRKDGRLQRFEDYLVEIYPTVFSIQISNADKSHPTARHDVLLIKRDLGIDVLHKLNELEIETVKYGADGIHAQIPSATYFEP